MIRAVVVMMFVFFAVGVYLTAGGPVVEELADENKNRESVQETPGMVGTVNLLVDTFFLYIPLIAIGGIVFWVILRAVGTEAFRGRGRR